MTSVASALNGHDAAPGDAVDRRNRLIVTIGKSEMDALEKRARFRWYSSMLPYKPNIDPAVQDELNHYSTGQLSRLYHEDVLGFIQLRNFIISPKELNEEIQRRRWLENLRFWLTFVLLCIAAVASVVAAYEGWRTR